MSSLKICIIHFTHKKIPPHSEKIFMSAPPPLLPIDSNLEQMHLDPIPPESINPCGQNARNIKFAEQFPIANWEQFIHADSFPHFIHTFTLQRKTCTNV